MKLKSTKGKPKKSTTKKKSPPSQQSIDSAQSQYGGMNLASTESVYQQPEEKK